MANITRFRFLYFLQLHFPTREVQLSQKVDKSTALLHIFLHRSTNSPGITSLRWLCTSKKYKLPGNGQQCTSRLKMLV